MIQREDKTTIQRISNTCPSSLQKSVVCKLARLHIYRWQQTITMWENNLSPGIIIYAAANCWDRYSTWVWLVVVLSMNFELYLRVYISEKWRSSFPSVPIAILNVTLPASRTEIWRKQPLITIIVLEKGATAPGSADSLELLNKSKKVQVSDSQTYNWYKN